MRSLQLFAEALACPFADPQALAWPDTVDHRHGEARLAERLRAFQAFEQAGDRWRQAWHGQTCWLAGLHHHATTLLQPGGSAWRLKPDRSDPGREILCWRAVSLRLPAGLLVAAAAEGDPPAWQVQVLDDVMVPRGPLAHLHLHGNAASAFEVLWTDQMTHRRRASGPPHFGEWSRWRARARLLRLVLAQGVESGGHDPFGNLFGSQRSLVERALSNLCCDLAPADEADLDGLTERLAPVGQSQPGSLAEVWRTDLLSAWYPGEWPEGRWLSCTLGYLRTAPPADSQAARWRRWLLHYLRLKVGLFTWLVADPAVRGLGAFTDTFGRANEFIKPLAELMPEHAELDPVLRPDALELRTAPKGILRWLDRPLPPGPREVGLVAHFIRTAKCDLPPVKRMDVFLDEARGLVDRMQIDPAVQHRLRGVDLAGDERRGPLWILVPALRHVIDVGRRNARRFHVPPLRTTLHVGEDFGHLLSGLRAVDEPLAWGLTGRGDRLGHALALGLDVAQWCKRNPKVPVQKVDRLLDLAWAMDRVGRMRHLNQAERGAWLAGLRAELVELVPHVAPDDAPRLFRNLGEPAWLAALNDRAPPTPDLFGLWRRWSRREPACVEALTATVLIDTTRDRDLMQRLQQAIAADLSALQVVIELNPTSNLCVGALENLVDQPFFQVRPWSPESRWGMPVTLSTDDPLQLATCLSDEYAYAWAGLVAGGVSPMEADTWIARAAEVSWRARFTRPTEAPASRPS